MTDMPDIPVEETDSKGDDDDLLIEAVDDDFGFEEDDNG